jgi:ureidoglycolate hydrolase
MATSITSVKGTSELKVKNYTHNPVDATTAAKIAWLPMAGFEWLVASAMLISGTGLLTMKIFAATDDQGTGAAEVIAHSAPTAADAAGDTLYLEATAEQCKEVLAGFTHVAVEIDCDHADDIVAVGHIFGGAHRKHAGLTADQIA